MCRPFLGKAWRISVGKGGDGGLGGRPSERQPDSCGALAVDARKPHLPDSIIRGVVESRYDLQVAELAFLPLGADAFSVVYRVETTQGAQLLLKGRQPDWFNPASLSVPLWLEHEGVPHVVSPLMSHDHGLWTSEHGWIWSLFPFLEGRLAAEAGLTHNQWYQLGETLQQIHAAHMEADLAGSVPVERFRPGRYDVLVRLAETTQRGSDDRLKQEFGRFWRAQQQGIDELVARVEALADELRSEPRPMVLCHADFHVWNILVGPGDELWILDWDETTFAPKERDLMFVVGSIARDLVAEDQAASFLEGYGNPELDRRALAYYRAAWALQDLAAYGEDVLFSPDLADASRRESFEMVLSLFEPGNIVSIALASEI